MKYNYTLEQALEAQGKGELGRWADEYLLAEGSNKKLAQHLRSRRGVSIILKEFPLAELNRVMGPEENMIWKEDQEKWSAKINEIKRAYKNGYKLPPLIVTDLWDDMHVSDGNHRLEALKELGVKKYWVLFFIVVESNIQKINKA